MAKWVFPLLQMGNVFPLTPPSRSGRLSVVFNICQQAKGLKIGRMKKTLKDLIFPYDLESIFVLYN